MNKLFVPYSHNTPCAVDINGHRVVLVSMESENMGEFLTELGGDEIREVVLPDENLNQSQALIDLAASVNGGIVLTPPGVSPRAMILSLEHELPWIH